MEDTSWPTSFSRSISYLAAFQRKEELPSRSGPRPLLGRVVRTPDIRHHTGMSPILKPKAQSFITSSYHLQAHTRPYGAMQTSAHAQTPAAATLLYQSIQPTHIEDVETSPVDMYKERQSGGSGLLTSVFNTTNMLMGVGILSLPFALRVAGWLGLVGLLGLSAVTNYTGRLLGRCMSRTHARAYPDIAYIAFGPRWKAVVGVVLYTELFMMTALFLVLMGTNLAHVFPRLSAKWCMAIAFLLLLPVLNLSDLRVLSYFSAVGTASTLVLVLVIIAYAGGQLSEAVHDRAMPADTVFIATDTFGFAFGLFACAYSGHAVFPSVYEAMQEKSQYPLVMFFTYIVVAVCYTSVACVGYLAFGSETSEEVTLNLPSTGIYGCVLWLCVLTAYTKYTLTLLPLAEGVAELLPPPKTPAAQLAVSTAVRTFLGLASLGVAVSIPSFGHLSALMGSVVTVLISIAFPVILYSRVFADSLTWVDYVQLSLTLCVAAVCGVYGLYAAIIGVGGA